MVIDNNIIRLHEMHRSVIENQGKFQGIITVSISTIFETTFFDKTGWGWNRPNVFLVKDQHLKRVQVRFFKYLSTVMSQSAVVQTIWCPTFCIAKYVFQSCHLLYFFISLLKNLWKWGQTRFSWIVVHLLLAMEEACLDIMVAACQGWIRHERLFVFFYPNAWQGLIVHVMLMRISGLTQIRDRMLRKHKFLSLQKYKHSCAMFFHWYILHCLWNYCTLLYRTLRN